MTNHNSIPLPDCLAVLKDVRRDDEVVITAMGAAREWQKLGSHPLDFVLVPSSMGQASSWGLGMALAQPSRKVIVCNGDGSTLMNLGSLVTITAEDAKNLVLVVLDNGVYEVTGAQATPGSAGARRDSRDVDYAAVARGCGFRSVYAFDKLDDWQQSVRRVIDAEGPTFVAVKVTPIPDGSAPGFPGPGPARALAFQAAIRQEQ